MRDIHINVETTPNILDDLRQKSDIVDIVRCRLTAAVAGIPVLEHSEETRRTIRIGDQESLLIG